MLLGLVLSALPLTLTSSPTFSDTPIPGTIDKNTTLDIFHSPYLLANGGTVVAKGATLTIEAGVKVKAQAGAGVLVYGELDIQGSKSNPVRFTSVGSGSPGSWIGIDMQSPFTDYGPDSAIRGCIIENAGQSPGMPGALRVMGLKRNLGHLVLDNTTIRGSGTAGLYLSGCDARTVEVANCTIEECAQRPIQLSACGAPEFDGTNRFRNNGQDCIGAGSLQGRSGKWNRAPVPYTWDTDTALSVWNASLTIMGATVIVPQSSGVEALSVGTGGVVSAFNTTFTSPYATPTPGYWSSLGVQGGGRLLLQNCRIWGAGRNSGAALRCTHATSVLHLYASEVAYCSGGAYINECDKQSAFRYTDFHHLNGTGLLISGKGANPVVADCRFENITGNAVYITGGASPRLGNLANADTSDDGKNAFMDRRQYAVRNESSKAVKAENNYWGFTGWKKIDQVCIYDHREQSTAGWVDFLPYRTVEPAGVHEGVAQPVGLTAVPTTAGGAMISFSLPAGASVDVTILNLSGRPIRRLWANHSLPDGPQTLAWDGRSDSGARAPAGPYLVRFTAYAGDGGKAAALTALRLSR